MGLEAALAVGNSVGEAGVRLGDTEAAARPPRGSRPVPEPESYPHFLGVLNRRCPIPLIAGG